MATLPDKAFDLAVVDPPYGLPKLSTTGQGKLKGRILNNDGMKWDTVPDELYFKELQRVSQGQIIWGANNFILSPTRGFICWDKVQPWPNFSACEYAWTSFDCPAKLFKFDNRTGDKIHPTQKPVALYDWILRNYAKPGQRIFDSHLGSGSSAIAAHYFGCDFVGCEIDEQYFNAAKERFDRETRQVAMW
jgi:site-specific DNA-methyltransferase (adenine-specific)